MDSISPNAYLIFRRLIVDIEKTQSVTISPLVEQYLTRLLVQRIRDTDIVYFRIAEQIPFAYEDMGLALRRVFFINAAESCLLLVGLFPQICRKRGVSINYYERWGRQMYRLAADLEPPEERYPTAQLENSFKRMARILRGIRKYRYQLPELSQVYS